MAPVGRGGPRGVGGGPCGAGRGSRGGRGEEVGEGDEGADRGGGGVGVARKEILRIDSGATDLRWKTFLLQKCVKYTNFFRGRLRRPQIA